MEMDMKNDYDICITNENNFNCLKVEDEITFKCKLSQSIAQVDCEFNFERIKCSNDLTTSTKEINLLNYSRKVGYQLSLIARQFHAELHQMKKNK